MHSLSALVPWWLRLAIKILSAPVPYRVWRRTSLFRHGGMQDASYVMRVFEKHRSFVAVLPPDPVLLELGPGDSVGTALIASAIGASRTYLLDSGRFANPDTTLYRLMARSLAAQGYDVPDISDATDVRDVLAACRATYLTDGVPSFAHIGSDSIDFAWSNTVLQHVRREEVGKLAAELRRVMKATGVASHTIDFRDMLGGALNHLRVPVTWWESPLVRRSGAYTNRLRYSELLNIFQEAGFLIQIVSQGRWTELPTPRRAMRAPFRRMADEDLLTYHVDVVMRPR